MQNNGEDANCMGYALDLEMHINADELDIDVGDLNQKSISYIHNFYVSKIEEWMDKNIAFRNWARITSYNSNIGLNQYRLVNRTGFHDIKVTIPGARRDLNDVWDKPSGLWYEEWPGQDENFDNHWWYQTNTGYWAEKPSKTEPSNRITTYSPLNESYWWDYSNKSGFTYYKIDTKGI